MLALVVLWASCASELGVLLHVGANPSSDTIHLCALLCGGLGQ